MQLYTSTGSESVIRKMESLNLGCLIPSVPGVRINAGLRAVPCALDNGAFTCSLRRYPFQMGVFLRTMETAYKLNVPLNFIACPDIVAGGLRSLEFSVRMADSDTLFSASNLYLCVQDGMELEHITPDVLARFAGLFIGGSTKWKWQTAGQWVQHAHAAGLKAHIGACGTLDKLQAARELGADSVDSSSFVRNGTWDIVLKFRMMEGGNQIDLFSK